MRGNTNIIEKIFRLCATQQLYEQVSCDEPDTEDTIEPVVERDKIVWESPLLSSKNKIVGNRVGSATGGKAELKAHEEDIKVRISPNISQFFHHPLLTGETAEQEAETGPCQGEDDRDSGE